MIRAERADASRTWLMPSTARSTALCPSSVTSTASRTTRDNSEALLDSLVMVSAISSMACEMCWTCKSCWLASRTSRSELRWTSRACLSTACVTICTLPRMPLNSSTIWLIASPKGCNFSWLEWMVEEFRDRKSTRLNSSHDQISYAVFCLKKKKKTYQDMKIDSES